MLAGVRAERMSGCCRHRANAYFPSISRSLRHFNTFYSVPTKQGTIKIDTLRAPQYIGHCTTRNMMQTNEDRFSLGFLDLPIRDSPQVVFNASIFDGHGGSNCADFLARNLASYVETADLAELAESLSPDFKKKFGGYWRSALILNSSSIKLLENSVYDDLNVRLPLSFLKADLDFLERDKLSGSTCTSAYLYATNPTDQFWYPIVDINVAVAQVGDTRAIICDNMGNFVPLTTIHRAESPSESDRLAQFSAGFNRTTDGIQRFLQYVNTRAFGDHQGKSRGIIAQPEVTEYQIGPKRGRLPGHEAFLVLCSDGVTDKVTDQEICDIIIQRAIQGGSLRGTPQDAAQEVVAYAGMLGTGDNATVIVIRLGGWGDWKNWSDRSSNSRENRLKNIPRRQ